MTDDEGLSVPEAADSAAVASQWGGQHGCVVWRTSLRAPVHGERAPIQSSQPDWAARP